MCCDIWGLQVRNSTWQGDKKHHIFLSLRPAPRPPPSLWLGLSSVDAMSGSFPQLSASPSFLPIPSSPHPPFPSPPFPKPGQLLLACAPTRTYTPQLRTRYAGRFHLLRLIAPKSSAARRLKSNREFHTHLPRHPSSSSSCRTPPPHSGTTRIVQECVSSNET